MNDFFSDTDYDRMIEALFNRFPSFQKVGAGAYKPGTANMEFADQLIGHPHRRYRIIHVAGTNGKGSVSNMLASVLSSCGFKTGLYTSPHILDFRERMRVIEPYAAWWSGSSESGDVDKDSIADADRIVPGNTFRLIPKQDVWNFVAKWRDTFDHLDLSFFEITTLMALDWFALQEVDVVVLETGLGGRLDSTNIVSPILSVITNIGLDHCDMLGETLPEIAFEKAGIIKPAVPVVVGESNPETDSVFERKVLYTSLSEPSFMGDRNAIMNLLTFADKVEPSIWHRHKMILERMDLRGDYQRKNLRTVLAALDSLKKLHVIGNDSLSLSSVCASASAPADSSCLAGGEQERDGTERNFDNVVADALIHAAARTGFRGRWETVSEHPRIICDIGHNEHGLKYNFAQLSKMKDEGECTDLIIVYGSVADKDVDAVIHLMPQNAVYIFTQADSRRALPADEVRDRYMRNHNVGSGNSDIYAVPDVRDAVAMAKRLAEEMKKADPSSRPLIYIGGSTYVVSEALQPQSPAQDSIREIQKIASSCISRTGMCCAE